MTLDCQRPEPGGVKPECFPLSSRIHGPRYTAGSPAPEILWNQGDVQPLTNASSRLAGQIAMQGDFHSFCVLQNAAGLLHLFYSPVADQNELVGFYLGFILDDAVFGDAHAVQSCANGTQTSDHNRPFERGNYPAHQWPRYGNGTYAGDH